MRPLIRLLRGGTEGPLPDYLAGLGRQLVTGGEPLCHLNPVPVLHAPAGHHPHQPLPLQPQHAAIVGPAAGRHPQHIGGAGHLDLEIGAVADKQGHVAGRGCEYRLHLHGAGLFLQLLHIGGDAGDCGGKVAPGHGVEQYPGRLAHLEAGGIHLIDGGGDIEAVIVDEIDDGGHGHPGGRGSHVFTQLAVDLGHHSGKGRLQAALGAIEQSTGYPLLRLPLLREYLFDPDMTHDSPSSAVPSAPTVLDEIERRLVMALQEGLPLFIRPFSVLASRVGCEENDVLERIRQWSAEGVIKRFGVVVRPQTLAAQGDALLVHDVPDADVVRLGNLLARAPGVSLCYQRPRVLPEWPYNLFCAVRGADHDEVRRNIADLRQRLKLTDCPFDILFALSRTATAA